jgi:tRNA pseudouridine55 synthase
MHGALLVDKPSGPTSHDIVAFARRALKTPGIGHTGTLDPLATGLLVLLIGHATRLSQFLVTDEKEYLADIRLGRSTETYDAQGLEESFRLRAEAARSDSDTTNTDSSVESRGFRLQAEDIDRVLSQFLGTFPQMPPPFSAKKVDGVRAYKKARRHEPVELKPVEVTLHELEVVDRKTQDDGTVDAGTRDHGLIRLRIVCSSGFYVRSLAHDIGQLLGCGAHLEALRRTAAGRFRLTDALTLDAIEAAGPAIESRLIGLNTLLADMPAVTLTGEGLRRAGNGNTLAPAHLAAPLEGASGEGKVRLLDPSGRLLSVAERRPDGLLHPLLVLR